MMLSPEKLTGIQQFKREFFSNRNSDPFCCSFLNQEIATSWKRSRDYGVDPNMSNLMKKVSKDDRTRLQDKYQPLIEITDSVFKTISLSNRQRQIVLSLITPAGIFLLRQGNFLDNFFLQDNKEVLVSTEQTAGTSAHALAFRFKRSFQLLGIEHYRNKFEDSITSASPVLDSNREVLAALGLRQYLPLDQQNNSKGALESSLKLISSLASIVETQYIHKMQNSYIPATTTDMLLNMAFDIMDQGILTIGPRGEILYGNKQSSQIFCLNQDEMPNYHIQQFLPKDSFLLSAISNDHDMFFEECFLINNSVQKYKVSIHPIVLNGIVDRYVLKFISPLKSTVSIRDIEDKNAQFTFNNIIGSSTTMQRIIDKAKCYSSSDENILITGESGTGKELFAQAIHNARRPDGPFIPINCSALPRDLAVSELFGYEGGSFSGSNRKGQPGKIELADEGTLFLDEIGDMPLELQPVLLRALQDKQIMRIGGQKYKKVNFQLICATNKDIDQLSMGSQFRTDLFYRISTLVINVPPLCKRHDDIKDLCEYFLAKHSCKYNSIFRISRETMDAIIHYTWPGNVRQLENVILGSLIAAKNGTIEINDLPDYLTDNVILPSFIPIDGDLIINEEKPMFDLRSYRRLDENVISEVMKQFNGNVYRAADYLGISRSTLYRRLKTRNN